MERKQRTHLGPGPEADFRQFCKTGDPDSMGRVFDALAPGLLLVASHLGADAHGAEDHVQQTFLAALERKDAWDPSRPLFPWLAGILTHKVREGQRRESLRKGNALESSARVANAPEPVDSAVVHEIQERVVEAIDRLGNPYRKLLVLHLLHGLKAHEIAHAIGRSPGTVRMQIKRGKEQLRGHLPTELQASLCSTSAATLGLGRLRAAVLAQSHPSAWSAASGWALPAALGVTLALVGALLAGVLGNSTTNDIRPLLHTGALATLPGPSPVPPRIHQPDGRLAGVRERQGASTDQAGAEARDFSIRVAYEDGSPVGGATVWREPVATPEQAAWTATRLGITAPNGQLESDSELDFGPWRFWATVGSGERSWAIETPARGAAPRARTTITFPRSAEVLWLRGRVLDPSSEKPLESVRLALECAGRYAPTWSGSDGRFKLGPIPADADLGVAGGSLLVARRADLGVRMAPWRKLADRISGSADEEARWPSLYMDPARKHRGQVVFGDGTPCPDAKIELPYGGGRQGAALVRRSDGKGRFEIPLPNHGGGTLIQARYAGFSGGYARVRNNTMGLADTPTVLRFAEDPGPQIYLRGFDESAKDASAGEGPYRVSIFLDGGYFEAPLWRGSAYFPATKSLASGKWGRAALTVSGSRWAPLAWVPRAVIRDTGRTELAPTRFKSGTLIVRSAEPATRFAHGLGDGLTLRPIELAPAPSQEGWPELPPFGIRLEQPTTRLEHVPVGLYEASDSSGRTVQIEVREGGATELAFPSE